MQHQDAAQPLDGNVSACNVRRGAGVHFLEAPAFSASRRADVCDGMSVLCRTKRVNTHGMTQAVRGLRAERAVKVVQILVSEERAHTGLVRRDGGADRRCTAGGLHAVVRYACGLAQEPDIRLERRQRSRRHEGEHVSLPLLPANAHAAKLAMRRRGAE